MNLASTALKALHGPTAKSHHDKLVQQTRKWVGLSFFQPILKQMRESPFRSKLLDGGRGGQAFSALYDQQLAQHMTRGTGNKLVNAIVRRIEAKSAYAKHAGKTGASTLAPRRTHVAAAF